MSKSHFLISKNLTLDTRNDFLMSDILLTNQKNEWYQVIEFLISKNHFIDTKNTIFDIRKCLKKFKTATHTQG